jgi:hypothetical protein
MKARWRAAPLGTGIVAKGHPVAVELREFSWQRMIEAVQAVRDRALRATAALEKAGIPYAMAGGNAAAAADRRPRRLTHRGRRPIMNESGASPRGLS